MSHPVFARVFDQLLSPAMEREVSTWRRELLAGLRGRVLELGAGNGASFVHYPQSVTEVVAAEPEPYLRARAELVAHQAPVRVSVREGVAEALPADSASFDAAVTSLVFCSLPDPILAASELRRVLRPGGELRFLEHVRSDRPPKATIQLLVDRSGIWRMLIGGCHCARDTVGTIKAAGFRIERLTSRNLGPGWLIINPTMLGSARVVDGQEPGRIAGAS